MFSSNVKKNGKINSMVFTARSAEFVIFKDHSVVLYYTINLTNMLQYQIYNSDDNGFGSVHRLAP